MRSHFATSLALLMFSFQTGAAAVGDVPDTDGFRPARVATIRNIARPDFSVASGTVVLDVQVSDKGEVRNVQVRRGIVSLTEVAVRAVRVWTFEPARVEGHAVNSRVTVAVTFNPASVLAANVPLPPLIHQDDETRIQSNYQPPEVTFATFPRYPVDAAGPGSVILEATLNDAGRVQNTKVLQGAPPFTDKAKRAARDWKFMPATLNGRPLPSKAILVFVFTLPTSPP